MKRLKTILESKTLDNESIYNLLYDLHFYMALSESNEDIKNGRVMTLDELDKEMEELYESYCNKKST